MAAVDIPFNFIWLIPSGGFYIWQIPFGTPCARVIVVILGRTVTERLLEA
jgi:hypothetical protein